RLSAWYSSTGGLSRRGYCAIRHRVRSRGVGSTVGEFLPDAPLGEHVNNNPERPAGALQTRVTSSSVKLQAQACLHEGGVHLLASSPVVSFRARMISSREIMPSSPRSMFNTGKLRVLRLTISSRTRGNGDVGSTWTTASVITSATARFINSS